MSWVLTTTLPATVFPAEQKMQSLESQGESPEEAFNTVYFGTWEALPQAAASSISQAPSAIANAITKPFIAFENTLKSWLIWLGLTFIIVIGLLIAIKLW